MHNRSERLLLVIMLSNLKRPVKIRGKEVGNRWEDGKRNALRCGRGDDTFSCLVRHSITLLFLPLDIHMTYLSVLDAEQSSALCYARLRTSQR
jgi:hypothetical protein